MRAWLCLAAAALALALALPAPAHADSARLQHIKRQILAKLGLEERPRGVRAPPRHVVRQILARAADKEPPPQPELGEEQHREIIVIANRGDSINGQPLIEFTLAAGRSDESLRVESATLYVRAEGRGGRRARQLRPTIWAFVVNNNGSTRLGELAGHARRRPHRAWQQLDVTGAARRWLSATQLQPASQHGPGPLRLLVDCSGCAGRIQLRLAGDAQHTPLLKLSVAAAEGRRSRRHTLDCGNGPRGHCCRQRHYISFRDLGWDDWIVAPAGYYANYCRGVCARTPDTFLNHHRHVLEEAARHSHAAAMPARCCAPTRFSALSLVYIAPDSTIVKRDLSDMVVEECGCP